MNSEAHRHVIGKIVLFQFSTLQRELQSTRNIYIYIWQIEYTRENSSFFPLYIHRQISVHFHPERINRADCLWFCVIFAWNATRRDVFLSFENRQIEYTRLFRLSERNDLAAEGRSFLDALLFRILDIDQIVSVIRPSWCIDVDFCKFCKFNRFFKLLKFLKFTPFNIDKNTITSVI